LNIAQKLLKTGGIIICLAWRQGIDYWTPRLC